MKHCGVTRKEVNSAIKTKLNNESTMMAAKLKQKMRNTKMNKETKEKKR